MNRKILHLDLDAFFCAVEEQRDPALVGQPFAVGGRPEQRGVVSSCSYPARQYGVRSAMPMGKALRLCPQLLVIPGHYSAYSAASRQVMERLRAITPLVEQISIDEAFLDVSDLPEEGETIARRLQKTIQDDLGLPCSLGIATNKLVAKIANDVGKASARRGGPPNAITVVPPGGEGDFLASLPSEALWGVGPKTAEKLDEMGIQTIGDIAATPVTALIKAFGKNGAEMAQHARGIDDRPIVTSHEIKSVSQETTFARDVRDDQTLRQTLLELSEGVAKRLRSSHQAGTTIKIKLRWPDFTTLTRQVTLEAPTDESQEIYQAAFTLLTKTRQPGQPVRLIGVGVSGLGHALRQLSLWDLPLQEPHTPQVSDKEQRLQTALAELKKKYGEGILKKGGEIH